MPKKLTKKQEKEFEKIKASVDRSDKERKDALKYSDRVFKKIENIFTDNQALALANICVQCDRSPDIHHLTLDWLLDHYIALTLENKGFEMFEESYFNLVGGKHTYQNPFEYWNSEAYYIPHEKFKIIVHGDIENRDRQRYLVVDDMEDSFEKFTVRNVWDRTKLDCIGGVEEPTISFYRNFNFEMKFHDTPRMYGDCRDKGHVLTYKRMLRGHGKCDHTIWDVNKPLGWFFYLNCLWTELGESK